MVNLRLWKARIRIQSDKTGDRLHAHAPPIQKIRAVYRSLSDSLHYSQVDDGDLHSRETCKLIIPCSWDPLGRFLATAPTYSALRLPDIKVSPYTRIITALSNAVSGLVKRGANTISRKPSLSILSRSGCEDSSLSESTQFSLSLLSFNLRPESKRRKSQNFALCCPCLWRYHLVWVADFDSLFPSKGTLPETQKYVLIRGWYTCPNATPFGRGGIGILQCAISSFPAPAKHDTFHAAAWAAFDSDILQARSQWCLLL